MAENYTPNNVATFVNDTTAVNTVNNNFAAISTAFTDVLSRSGVTPNQMTSTLDMNNNQIINLPPPQTVSSPARLIDVTTPGAITITTATTGTSGHTVPFLDGNNTWSGTNLFNPPTGLNISYLATMNVTGTTSGLVCAGVDINSDNANSSSNVIGFQVNQIFGGTAAQGSRYAITAQCQLNSPTNVANANRSYSGLLGQGIANTGDGGTSPTSAATSSGQIFGVLGQALLQSAATSLEFVNAGAFGTLVGTGASMWAKSLMTLQGLNGDAVGGSGINTMLWLNNQTNAAVKWTNGILIDNWGGLGGFPIATTGTIMKTAGAFTVTNGIDFSATTFSGSPFISPGFSISSTGAVQSGVAGVSTGVVSLNGTTSGFISIAGTATSGQLNVTSSTNSTIIGVGNIGVSSGALTLAGLTSGSATINVSATGGTLSISNQLNVLGVLNTGQTGGTAGSLGIVGSTSGTSTLAVDATGNLQITSGGAGAVKLGAAGSFTANGTVATSVTSLGPTGASTTVVKWLTIIDNTGATRYIPCF